MTLRRLPETLVNRIAAGEVIERPAAAVKELVENAIDAGARHIDAVLEDGGRILISVTDDGCGMTADELELAVERHATSKLPDDDLVDIRTLGFRGEALPSIGAVSRLSIASRAAGASEAYAILIEGGRKEAPKPAALGNGTRIEVRDLFYATPARLKFLKTPGISGDFVWGLACLCMWCIPSPLTCPKSRCAARGLIIGSTFSSLSMKTTRPFGAGPADAPCTCSPSSASGLILSVRMLPATSCCLVVRPKGFPKTSLSSMVHGRSPCRGRRARSTFPTPPRLWCTRLCKPFDPRCLRTEDV